MSKLGQTLQELAPTALLEFFVLDLTPDDVGSNNKYYFHAGTNGLTNNVTWQGQSYTAFPIEVTGYDQTTVGQLPRLRLRAANVNALLTTILLDFNDMVGAKLTRKRTFAKYLDAVNFPGGVNANADSTVELPDDIFYAERKVSENHQVVEVEFASAFDVEGVMLPRRQVTWNICAWRYRSGVGCTYAGAVKTDSTGADIVTTPLNSPPFSEWSNVTAYSVGYCVWYLHSTKVYICIQANTGHAPTETAYWKEDVCPKRLEDCKKRFGTYGILPFGAFPGVERLPQ